MAKNKNIDDDTRKRAKAFVEKNNKEYRADPFGAMTQKERDARVGSVDDFFSRIASKAEPRAIAAEDDATLRLPKKEPRVVSKKEPRIVSKKELEESGLSLRDFLNRERGLTRRGMSVEEAKKQLKLGSKPSAEEVAKAKKQLGLNKGGMVKANCGASVPPAQKRK